VIGVQLLQGCGVSAPPWVEQLEIIDEDLQVHADSAHDMEIEYQAGSVILARFHDDSDDPHINFYRNFDTSTAGVVEIEAEGLPPQELDIYWAGSTGCTSISGECRVQASQIESKGLWRANLADHCLWTGEIKHFRLDFNEGSSSPFTLRSIRFFREEVEPAMAATRERKCNRVNPKPPAPVADPKKITTNMFDLDLTALLTVPRTKQGGALGSTDSELILLAGDGLVRTLDLSTMKSGEPEIELPQNHQQEALIAAQKLEPLSASKSAAKQIKERLRYDDILVFDDARERHLILSYSHFAPKEGCFTHRLSKLSVPKQTQLARIKVSAADWVLVFEANRCFGFRSSGNLFSGHQSGGRIDVLNAETGDILLALGDYEFDGHAADNYPQDKSIDYGKVLKINIGDGAKEMVSFGHRNPQGIKVDAQGRIWSVEHGPRGGDELNRISWGANYGWPFVSLGLSYGSNPWPPNPKQGRHEKYRRPTFAWVPSIGISNVDQIVNFHPFWEDDLLVFSLNGFRIERLRIRADRVVFSERIDLPVEERVRYGMTHAPTKSLYLWTDSGKLYQVKPAQQAWDLLEKSRSQHAKYAKEGRIEFDGSSSGVLAPCLDCHHGGRASPPRLSEILGNKVAGGEYFRYSSGLKNQSGVWSEQKLKDYLLNPQNFAPGTSMPDQRIDSDLEAEAIIAALKELSR